MPARTPTKRYHENIIQTMRDIGNNQRWFTSALNLGGVPGPGGGSGVPIGGLIGQLIQSKISYDTTEASSLTIPPSGQSLVHNLNRIRYWINEKPKIVVLDEGNQVLSGVREIDFIGPSVTAVLAGGYSDRVEITISGVGGEAGSGVLVAVSADDTTPNYLEGKLTAGSSKITVTTANPGGNEERQVDLGTVAINDINDVTITSVGNDEVLGYDSGWVNRTLTEAGISATGHTHTESNITDLAHLNLIVQEDDVETASGITTLNFEGAVTTLDEGSGKVTITVSGVSGSGIAGIDVEEAGTPKVTDATILNFVSGATIVDAGGGQADITVSGGGGGPGVADFTMWMPDAPPASPSSYDDEFENSSVAGKWTEWDVSDTMTPNEAEYGFYMSGGTINDGQGIWQDVPDQDFAVYAYVGAVNNETGDDVGGILLLEDSGNLSTSDALIYGLYRGSSMGIRAAWLNSYSSWNSTMVDRTGGPGGWEPGYWLRLRQVGSQWYFGYSIDGYHWFEVDDGAEKFTVDAVGLGQRINPADGTNRYYFKSFRYTTNASLQSMLYGDRVNMWRA